MSESKSLDCLRQVVLGASPASPPEGCRLDRLAAAARQQGVTTFVLSAVDEGRLPWAVSLRPELAAERRSSVVRTMAQLAVAGRLITRLGDHGIRALPLKGVALAETVCQADLDRPMSDVDLLTLEHWAEANAVLGREGLLELTRADHAWAYREPGTAVVVELHRSLTSAPALFPFDPEAFWSRRRVCGGQQRFVPSAEDLLVHAALHASFQHGLVLSLVQWLDFRRILERERLDFSRLLAIAASARASVAVGVALLAAREVVSASIPASLHLLVDRVPSRLRAWLDARLAEPLRFLAPAAPDLARLRWAMLAGRRGELVWRTLVRPETESGDTRLGLRLLEGLRRGGRLLRVAHQSRGEGARRRNEG